MNSLRKENKLSEDNLIRLNAGIKHKRKPAYVLLDEQLVFAVSHYIKNELIYQKISELALNYNKRANIYTIEMFLEIKIGKFAPLFNFMPCMYNWRGHFYSMRKTCH